MVLLYRTKDKQKGSYFTNPIIGQPGFFFFFFSITSRLKTKSLSFMAHKLQEWSLKEEQPLPPEILSSLS